MKEYLRDEEVKKSILMMYELAGDNDLKYYEAIQKIIDYISDLENLSDKYEEEHNTTFKEWQEAIKENERLKLNHKQLKDIEKMAISNSKLIKEKDDYKTRIEKAVEYIKVNNSEWKWSMFGRDDLLNILNGRSDE